MKCKQCNFETPMVSDFRHHMYLIHNAKKPNFHRCEKCNEKFYNFEELLIHRDEKKCGGTEHQDELDLGSQEPNSDDGNGKIKLDGGIGLPTLKLERLSAEIFAQHSPAIVTSATSQKIRVCVICKSHISQKNLITHIRAIHVNCNTFKCSLCVKGFNDKMALNNHILQHHTSVRPFLCNLCGAGFSARKYVVPHILGCLKNNWQKCQETSSETKNGTVDDYVKEITGEVPCPMCKALCSNYSSLVNHIKRHRIVQPGDKVKIKPEPEKKLHECEVCAMKFADWGKLVSHKRVHQMSTGVAAKRFRKKLKQSNQLKMTTSKNGTNGIIAPAEQVSQLSTTVIRNSPNGKIFLCDYTDCQYVSKNEANMKRHKRCVHKEGVTEEPNKDKVVHNCHLCGYTANQQGNLIRHLANAHNVGELRKCNICSFESHSKEKMKSHMKKIHDISPTATCKGCGTEFKNHYEMKVHQWQHLRENIPCGNGNSSIYAPSSKSKKSKKSKLTTAAKIKTENGAELPENKQFHVCKECGKSFIRKRYLQKHIDCMHTKSDDENEPYEMQESADSSQQQQETLNLPQQTPIDEDLADEHDEFAALNFSSQQIRVIEIDAI